MASPADKRRFVLLRGGAGGGASTPPKAFPVVPQPGVGPPLRDHPAPANDALARAVPEASPSERELDFDRSDVPAAVVCARCGEADCLGCDPDEERSGFLTIVPWEREGGALRRGWLTARLATEHPETFFEALPDGLVAPAVRFAIFAELAAAAAIVSLGLGSVAALLPALVDASTLGFVARALLVGLPSVALLLVGAHVLHGLALDVAARRVGGRSERRRALRFGLYAAGWDVILGPIGLVGLLFAAGPAAAMRALGAASRAPSRASRAFLRGTYGLVGEPADRALRGGFVGAAVATLVAAVVLLFLAGLFVLAWAHA